MARKKLNLEEIEMEQTPVDKEPLPFPELPLDMVIDEAVIKATNELEIKNNNLIQQIYQKEQEISQLRLALEDQARKFESTIAALVYDFYGR